MDMTAHHSLRDLISTAIHEHIDTAETFEEIADEVIKAIRSAPGIAIIELPEQVNGVWSVDREDDDFHVGRVHLVDQRGKGLTGSRIYWGAVELTLSPAHTRNLAAALLAACAADHE